MGTMVEKFKILAVDDNPINLKLLSSALINSDYEIYTASSGQQALELANSVLPDLILLDVMMPDMDGYEVCKKLQENKNTQYIPVIFLSARNEAVDKAKGLALGAVDYLTKPFNPLEINARVRTHLTSRRAVIRLMRENQKLQNELEKIKAEGTNSEKEKKTIDYLRKIDGYIFHVKEEQYELFSMAKNDRQPITRTAIPVSHSPKMLVLLHYNGFNKDYQTLIVKQLVQKFLEGYLLSIGDVGEINATVLTQLFLTLLEKFSPDFYQVPFTFGLSVLNFEKQKIYFLGLHQREPLVIFKNGKSTPLSGKKIDVNSELRNFITAIETDMEHDTWIAWYQNDSKPVEIERLRTVLMDALEKSEFNLQQFVLLLDQQIKPAEQDVCFSVIEIKP
ncbi:response regulator [Caldithrix abyssi]|uniref:Response regulator receiver domain-containing protein n=2 Tax=Caldithrix abyssi DSM 13497 TaxID=880073 RepID=A0A1J1C7Y7_CALAY|nr:response regulator [Caldithrix abyssi]APF18811.1 Response regulator receiver domain-containing protein [Caldithrix abyssi DSM 13497]